MRFQKEIIVPTLIFSFVSCLLAYGAIFWIPLMIKNTVNETEQLILRARWEEDRAKTLPEKEDGATAVRAAQSRLGVLASTEDPVSLIEELERLGDETGCDVSLSLEKIEEKKKEGETTKTESKPTYEEKKMETSFKPAHEVYYKTTIKAVGSAVSVFDFLNKVENLRFFGDIATFSIKPEKSKDVQKTVQSFSTEPSPGVSVVNDYSSSQNAPVESEDKSNDLRTVVGQFSVYFYAE